MEENKEKLRFKVEFSNGCIITFLAFTEKEAYEKARKKSKYEIVEIWED